MRRYVWRCDARPEKLVRTELRIPEQLRDLLLQAAETAGVSFNAYMVGVLTCLASEEMQGVVSIELATSPVRVTVDLTRVTTKR